MFAGMLNKLGKIGVIVGFCLGNAILTYVANGNTIAVITIREILIASLGLLLIPKNVNIDISDIVGKTKLLPVTGGAGTVAFVAGGVVFVGLGIALLVIAMKKGKKVNEK